MAFLLVIVSAITFQITAGVQQSLTQWPANKTAVVGETVVLMCQVSNLKGVVQWTRGGVALGYDRNIRGYGGRYQMTGSDSQGEYDLSISNVQLSDETVYQCQVTPTETDPPLYATAYLTVNAAPSSTYIDGYTNGSVVVLPVAKPSLNLTCWSRNAKPAATITWLRNGVPLPTLSFKTTITASIGSTGLFDVSSMLPIQSATTVAETDVYSCRASNAALPSGPNVVTLGVILPAAPTLYGYTTGTALTPGQVVTLSCASAYGVSYLYWYSYRGSGTKRNLTSSDATSSCNDVVLSSLGGNGVRQCTGSLNINVKSTDNKLVYGCATAYSATSEVTTAEVTMTVLFSPTDVVMSGDKNVTSGNQMSLTCQSSVSNPPTVISWLANGVQINNGITSTTLVSDNGFVTTSELRKTATWNDNSVTYQCSAANNRTTSSQQPIVDSITLNVYFSPTSLELIVSQAAQQLSGTSALTSVRVGQAFNITCLSTSANPAARLTLCTSSGGGSAAKLTPLSGTNVQYQNEIRTRTVYNDGWRTSITATIVPTVNEDGRIYCCMANDSSAVDISSSKWPPQTAQQATSVLYKPQFIVQPAGVLAVVEHDSLVLNATAIGNPPDVTYSWSYSSEGHCGATAPAGVALPASSYSGPRAVLINVDRNQFGTYCCAARNSEGVSWLPFRVDVEFPASIVSTSVSPVVVNVSDTAVIFCNASSNPTAPDDGFLWTAPKSASDDLKSRMSVSFDAASGSSVLRIARTLPTDSGNYQCSASNGVGAPATANIELVVSSSTIRASESPVVGLTTINIIVIAVPVSFVVLVVVILIVLCCVRRRCKRKKPDFKSKYSKDVVDGNDASALPIQLASSRHLGSSSSLSSNDKMMHQSNDTYLEPCDVSTFVDSAKLEFINGDLKSKRPPSGHYDSTTHCDKYNVQTASIGNGMKRLQPDLNHVSFSQPLDLPPRQKIKSQISTDSGYRLWNEPVTSEHQDEANYSDHLRELQRYSTRPGSPPVLAIENGKDGGVPAVFVRSRSLSERSQSKPVRPVLPVAVPAAEAAAGAGDSSGNRLSTLPPAAAAASGPVLTSSAEMPLYKTDGIAWPSYDRINLYFPVSNNNYMTPRQMSYTAGAGSTTTFRRQQPDETSIC